MPFRVVAPTSVNCGRSRRIDWAVGPFAEHDVELEILHCRIEHFFDGSGKSVNLVDEEHIARVQVGEDGGEVAGPVEGGPEVTRIFTSSSLAMTPASVVFPSPGGPENRT